MDAEEGTQNVIEIMEKISARVNQSQIKIDLIDAFCEKGKLIYSPLTNFKFPP